MTQNGKNTLGEETSPYLRQHKDNPVYWYPWNAKAFEEAKRLNKPILLSVGYAACHWCHVMAHESFEDQETADVMNALFINIKVDREERPDVDTIYMSALHMIGEQGGWPLTMFLTPEGEPFWGGTYFPKEQRYGRPAFVTVLEAIAAAFHNEPDKVRTNADALRQKLQPSRQKGEAIPLSDETLDDWSKRFLQAVDTTNGGMRGAPKFPQTQFFEFLWQAGLRYGTDSLKDAVSLTLTHICQGGIYDHIGGGFARYSVDELWLVPHFEKMLYDNALLIDLMTEAWREDRNPLFAMRIEETISWLLSDMLTAGGGFAASYDADSEGVEGKFYVWSLAEIVETLGKDEARLFAEIYDITEAGNFEGKNIPNRLHTAELRGRDVEVQLILLRAKLHAHRSARIAPGFDDKVLSDWNGLTIAALANAASAFEEDSWLEAAETAFAFICTQMTVEGRLRHAYREGVGKAPGTASDYANMIMAALKLANVTGKPIYVNQAIAWTQILDKHYWNSKLGGYHLAADDTDDLIVRPFSGLDEATPNANAVMVQNLLALTSWTGEIAYTDRAEAIVTAFGPAITANPVGHAGLLGGALRRLSPALIVFVVPHGGDASAMRAALGDVSLPGAVVREINEGEELPASSPAHGKSAIDGKVTAYVCLGPQCSLPVTDPEALVETIKKARAAVAT